MDFHHLPGYEKLFNVSNAWRSKGYATVAAEIAKCLVVCANCHRRLHAGTIEIPKELLP
jgi:hypothetical protein